MIQRPPNPNGLDIAKVVAWGCSVYLAVCGVIVSVALVSFAFWSKP